MVDGWGVGAVRVTCPFWTAWQDAVSRTGLPHQWLMCEETGRVENFRRAARGASGGHQGRCYDDSDLYKWAEAAAYAAAADPDTPSRPQLADFVRWVAAAQTESGYLDTYIQLGRQRQQWKCLTALHEMYCLGHLIEAGVAAAQVEPALLECAVRAADHVASVFGPDRRLGYCGHEEIELALCRLSDATGMPERRRLARWMTQRRGGRPSPFELEMSDPETRELASEYVRLVERQGRYDGSYLQDDTPLVEQTAPVGHAVRAMYHYCGALDADSATWLPALRRIWDEMVSNRIYVTGGVGSAPGIEGFGPPYDLPNRTAYAETCAAIGLVFWAARMSRATKEAKYGDWLERALVNAVLSGVGLEGDQYFYDNPLASEGDKERKPWFDCACCPPNLARLVMSVGKYLAWADQQSVTIDVAASMEFVARPCGVRTVVNVRSEWPWGGAVSVTVRPERPVTFRLRLRIPAWVEGLTCQSATECGGYLAVDRSWSGEQTIDADFVKRPKWIVADPRVADAAGKVALVDGPVVYCLEEADLRAPVVLFSPNQTAPVRNAPGGDPRVRALVVEGTLRRPLPGPLYRPCAEPVREPTLARLVPAFAWANRGRGSMAVWLTRS